MCGYNKKNIKQSSSVEPWVKLLLITRWHWSIILYLVLIFAILLIPINHTFGNLAFKLHYVSYSFSTSPTPFTTPFIPLHFLAVYDHIGYDLKGISDVSTRVRAVRVADGWQTADPPLPIVLPGLKALQDTPRHRYRSRKSCWLFHMKSIGNITINELKLDQETDLLFLDLNIILL